MSAAALVRADARQLPLSDDSVDLVVTSPPYYQQRSYTDGGEHYEGQIGDEPTVHDYVDSLLAVTAELVRVVKPSGSIFVNLGDKYASTSPSGSGGMGTSTLMSSNRGAYHDTRSKARPRLAGIRPKSLMGVPWRYALGCIDELGLIVRAELIWSKLNGLPESVTDRVRRSHETWLHITLEERYYSSIDNVREPYAAASLDRYDYGFTETGTERAQLSKGYSSADGGATAPNPLGRLPTSVWPMSSEPFTAPPHLEVEHHAAFPSEWPRRLILGWSPAGICTVCGEGRRPHVERTAREQHDDEPSRFGGDGVSVSGLDGGTVTATGFVVCACNVDDPLAMFGLPPTRPAVVLDPFSGTGTTVATARALGRVGVGFELSADYLRLARWRCSRAGDVGPRVRERTNLEAQTTLAL